MECSLFYTFQKHSKMYSNVYNDLIRDLCPESFDLKMKFFKLYLTQVLAVRT